MVDERHGELHRDARGATNPEVRHERQDVRLGGVLLFGAFLVFGAVVIHVFLWSFYTGLAKVMPCVLVE